MTICAFLTILTRYASQDTAPADPSSNGGGQGHQPQPGTKHARKGAWQQTAAADVASAAILALAAVAASAAFGCGLALAAIRAALKAIAVVKASASARRRP